MEIATFGKGTLSYVYGHFWDLEYQIHYDGAMMLHTNSLEQALDSWSRFVENPAIYERKKLPFIFW